MTTRTYNNHPYIEGYFNLIDSEDYPVCKEQYQLKEFLIKVLNRDDVYINSEMVENSVNTPAKYFPYNLYPWQKFINVFIFGLRWKKDDSLVFNRFFLYMGRGGGKNGYISWNSFFMLSKQHGIQNYDIDIVATSEDQAKTSFNDVVDVLESPEHEQKLKKAFYHSKVLVKNKSTKSSLMYNTSNAKTKDSKRTGCVIFDEEHAYENYDTIKVFTSGGGKVDDYREFHISTDGDVRGGPLDDLKEEARMVLNGELDIEQSTLFPFMCRLDNPSEVDNFDMWTKANPSLPYNDTLKKKMVTEYHQMQRSTPIRLVFMGKRMNLPMEDTRKAVATYEEVKATDQPIPKELLRSDVIGGLDYAQIRDFCSCGILTKYNGKRYWLQHTFMHHTAPKLQAINPDIINLAIEKKLLTVVYDESIDASHVVSWYLEQAKHYNIRKIAMDEFRASILREPFEKAGFDIEIVRKGYITHGKLSPLIEEMFVKKDIVFGDDPLMRWYVGNVYKDEKANGNIEYKKIDKEKRKTDGFFAFLHALNFDSELNEQIKFNPTTFKVRTY
nr:terminase [Bacillaceae bacterium]